MSDQDSIFSSHPNAVASFLGPSVLMDVPGMLVASTKAVPVVLRALLEEAEAHHAHVHLGAAGELAHHDHLVEVVVAAR